ncbi:hypothetical protein Tco_0637192 [Tanacetum coccineum]
MEVVVAATVAAAATAVVHGGCDGGDFGEVEWRRGGGVRMMMMAAVGGEDGAKVVGSCGVGLMKVAVIGRNPVGTRERRRKILEGENKSKNFKNEIRSCHVVSFLENFQLMVASP